MPHGSGISLAGRIPPSGVARSSGIWDYPSAAFALPVQPAVGQSSLLGYSHCLDQVGGVMLLLLPGGAAALDSNTISVLNALQSPSMQVKVLGRATMGLSASYTLTHWTGPNNSLYGGSTGVTFPKVAGATACWMQGFTVQSGSIYQENSNAYATPGYHNYGGFPGLGLDAGNVNDFAFPFAGIGPEGGVSPGVWDGHSGGWTNLIGSADGPSYSASFVSGSIVPLGGGYVGMRALSSMFCGFAASLNGTWSAQFVLYFTWYTLVPWIGVGSPPGVDDVAYHRVLASSRGGCC